MIILDIDKPEFCNNCPCYYCNDELSCCAAHECDDIQDPYTIPEWCPIGTLDESIIDIVATKLFEHISAKMDERNDKE